MQSADIGTATLLESMTLLQRIAPQVVASRHSVTTREETQPSNTGKFTLASTNIEKVTLAQPANTENVPLTQPLSMSKITKAQILSRPVIVNNMKDANSVKHVRLGGDLTTGAPAVSSKFSVVPGGLVGLLDTILTASSVNRHHLGASQDNRYFVEGIVVNDLQNTYLSFNHPPNHEEIITTFGQQNEMKFGVILIDKSKNSGSVRNGREALVIKIEWSKKLCVRKIGSKPDQHVYIVELNDH